MERVGTANPHERIATLTLSSNPGDAARVGFAAVPSASGAPGRRGETRYVDPYTGEMLAKLRGEDFFRTVTQMHRYLVSGAIGKQIVGASTVGLLILALSGLYLRWPRRPLDGRVWLTFSWAQKGRGFLWSLHSVAGTWVLLCYLLAALTGLYWSYNWYRDALFAITGTPRPARMNMPAEMEAAKNPLVDKQPREPDFTLDANGKAAIDKAWGVFRAEVAGFSTATLRLPDPAGPPVQITYLDIEAPHQRATNRITFDPATGRIAQHERYRDKPAGGRIMSSIFSLHSGRFFGVPGAMMMMLASLTMPLSAISGWMLYLDRRKKRTARGRDHDVR
jgi:sulfite reductase (NADPH) flavoprotein alpha-component